VEGRNKVQIKMLNKEDENEYWELKKIVSPKRVTFTETPVRLAYLIY
jgi:hypothetical protein